MERAWALLQMKQALEDAPWEEVESRLQMSRARRQQLLRLTAFTPSQQQQYATEFRNRHADEYKHATKALGDKAEELSRDLKRYGRSDRARSSSHMVSAGGCQCVRSYVRSASVLPRMTTRRRVVTQSFPSHFWPVGKPIPPRSAPRCSTPC